MEKLEALRQLGKLPFSTLLTFTSLLFIPVLSFLALQAPFSEKTKKLVRGRCHNRSELTDFYATDRDRIQIHHIKPQYRGGTSDISNAIAVLSSEHRLIHLVLDGFDMRKYQPSIPDCTKEQEESVLLWLQHTNQLQPV
jgi:hypothetical protein